jgi:CxxC motif-containing protein (DUF1111 family)
MSSGALAGDVSVERADLTPKDLARVRAVTEPASDFSKPEAFEAMPGGAATSRKKVNRDALFPVFRQLDLRAGTGLQAGQCAVS